MDETTDYAAVLLKHTTDVPIIAERDDAGNVTHPFCGPSMERVLGYEPSLWTALTFEQLVQAGIIHADDVAPDADLGGEMSKWFTGTLEFPITCSFRIKHKLTGDWRHIECTANEVPGSNGRQCAVVMRDVTDALAKARERGVQADMLREIQHRRDELEKYVMTLCHELRTPLNGTMGLLQVLQIRYAKMPDIVAQKAAMEKLCRDTALTGDASLLIGLLHEIFSGHGGPDAINPLLAKMMALAELQTAICEDLLDHTRASTGVGAKPKTEPFSLKQALDEALTCVQMAMGKGREGDDATFSSTVCVEENVDREYVGDKRRITQLLINLLSNAFKATESGSVTISAQMCGNNPSPPSSAIHTVCIRIADTGMGMSEQRVKANFASPFAGGASNSNGSSTGLGFGIVRHVVEEILGGRLRVKSKLGEGTTIQVSLPLKLCGASEGSNSPQTDTDVPTPPLIRRDYVAPAQFPILVVDDIEFNREILLSLLAEFSHTRNIDTADDGDTCLELVNSRHERGEPPYAVVFMDVSMRRVNGDDATKTLRSLEAAEGRARTHVVGLSGFANDSTRESCLKKGMDVYMTKPMQLQRLQELLASLPVNNRTPGWSDRNQRVDAAGAIDVTDATGALDALDAADSPQPPPPPRTVNLPNAIATTKPIPVELYELDRGVVDLVSLVESGVPMTAIKLGLAHVKTVELQPTLNAALARGDYDKIKKHAHKLKGSFGYINAETLTTALASLETAATWRDETIDVDKIRECVSVCERELECVKAAIGPLEAAM